MDKPSTKIFLNNIRSAHNAGAIFRTADGAGVDEIYLGGYCPLPIDRFGRTQPEIVKTSLGASETIPWQAVPGGEEAATLSELKAAGYTIVVVEQTPASISLYDFVVPKQVVYVFGNEVTGVDTNIIELADECIEIPMHGSKESLNVATTVGVVLFTPRCS